jgi:hypothetical protein
MLCRLATPWFFHHGPSLPPRESPFSLIFASRTVASMITSRKKHRDARVIAIESLLESYLPVPSRLASWLVDASKRSASLGLLPCFGARWWHFCHYRCYLSKETPNIGGETRGGSALPDANQGLFGRSPGLSRARIREYDVRSFINPC